MLYLYNSNNDLRRQLVVYQWRHGDTERLTVFRNLMNHERQKLPLNRSNLPDLPDLSDQIRSDQSLCRVRLFVTP